MSGKKFWILPLLLAFVSLPAAGSIDAISNPKTLGGDDVDAQELRSIIIEGWEVGPWDAVAAPGAPQSNVEVNLVEGKPRNLGFDDSNKKSMGLRFRFVYPGTNIVTLTPPKDKKVRRYIGQLDEKNQPKYYEVPGIELPGKVKALSLWVLGRGNNYDMDVMLEDWRGDTHVFSMGNLNYIGWRPLTLQIPDNIPQAVDSYPQTKTMILKKIIIKAKPNTTTEETVLFLDSMKVLTDMYDVFFDGASVDFDDKDKAEKVRMKEYQQNLRKYSTGENGSSTSEKTQPAN